MPPRRRTPTSSGVYRRPRVAGLAPAAARPAAAGERRPADAGRAPVAGPEAAPVPDPAPVLDPAPTGTLDPAPDGERDGGPDAPPDEPADAHPVVDAAPGGARAVAALPGRWVAGLRARPDRSLAVALTVAVALAVGLGVADHLVRSTPSAANTALTDVGTTADVAGQLGSALETVYSYDFTQLDENERLARAVITPEFAAKFDQLFAQVRRLAPQQQAVVSATVTASAVQSIEGDRAVLVAFLDQQATRANPGSQPQQLNAAGRLTVIGQRDGDAWKIADVVNR